MKTTKKNSKLIAFILLAVTFNACSMEPGPAVTKENLGWAALVGGVLLGAVAIRRLWQPQQEPFPFTDLPKQEPFPFTDLPKEIQSEILSLLTINVNAESLETAAQTINALAQVNKELNAIINEPVFCLKLIKYLAKKFNCSDAMVCERLQTQEAKRRLDLQTRFFILCQQNFDVAKDELTDLLQQGVDLEFTIGEWTPLMVASAMGNVPMIQFLLANGAHINAANTKGQTVLMFAAGVKNIANADGIEELVSYSDLDINQQDLEGNTALMYLVQPLIVDEECFEHLLNAGADPELANFAGLTPLAVAQKKGRLRIINLIQQAIDKKHGK